MHKTIQNTVIASMLALTIMTAAAPAPRAYAATDADAQAQIAALIAQITKLQAQIAAQQGTTTGNALPKITLPRDLQVGSSGQDVRDLQRFLNADSDTRIATTGAGSPGNETTLFGPMTKAAVIKFQNKYRAAVLTPAGLTNGTGYVGASTRAHIAKIGGTGSSNTGGSNQGSGSQNQNSGSATQGTEGDLSVTRGSEHTSTLELSKTDDIYSVQIKAEDSDMTIERIDFNFDQRVWKYLDSFELYQGTKKIASMKATENNFSKVGNEYRLRFTGLDAVVKEDDKDTFTLKAKAQANLSSSREQDIVSIYVPRNGIRAKDTMKLMTNAPSTDLDARAFDFYDSEHDGEIVVTLDGDSPESGALQVSTNGNTNNVPVLVASLKAKKDDIELKEMYLKVTSSETNVTNVVRRLTLQEGSTVIATEDVRQNGSTPIIGTDEEGNSYTIIGANEYYVYFDELDEVTIDEDERAELTVLAEFHKQSGRYAEGTEVTFTVRAALGENSFGEDVTNGNLTVGDHRTFTLFTEGLTYTFTSADADTRGDARTSAQYTITFNVKAFGGDLYIPTGASRQTGTTTVGTGGLEYRIVNGDHETYALGSASQTFTVKNAKTEGSFYRITEGTTATITFKISLENTGGDEGFYKADLEAIRYRSGSTNGTEHTLETGLNDFVTEFVSVRN